MITRLVGIDFETTGVDVQGCEVVQAAYVVWEVSANRSTAKCRACDGKGKLHRWHFQDESDLVDCPACGGIDAADDRSGWSESTAAAVLCRPSVSIPAGATEVHGITNEQVADAAPFSGYAEQLMAFVEAEPGTALVTFNGRRFDVPIWERFAGRSLRVPHIDVYRLHQRARIDETECEHVGNLDYLHSGTPEPRAPRWTANVFGGSLQAAHTFWTGAMFEGAHDALVDVRATLETLRGMLDYPDPMAGGYTLERAIEVSTQPMPGELDMDGKFKWSGDSAVLTIGKHKGTPLQDIDAGYLRWMLSKDFADDTKKIARDALKGVYPTR